MSNPWWARCARLLLCALFLGASSVSACVAQPDGLQQQRSAPAPLGTGYISGTVSDPSGAKIPGAVIAAEGPGGSSHTISDAGGHFLLTLPSGQYRLTISATGFQPYTGNATAAVGAFHTPIDARLAIAAEAEEVTVPSDNTVSTAAGENKSALVFKGDDLKTFSDDNATFDRQIQALAGDDGSGPQIYVDGFSGGHFPPKNAIREIRINQNPYSAQYDEIGYGRIEIFTKPGADQLHANLDLFGNDSAFNSNDPFLQGTQLPYHSQGLFGDFSGPLNKKTSFFLSTFYNNQQINAAVHASTLDAQLLPTTLLQSVPSPSVASTYSARLDRQVTAANTLTARYEINLNRQTNAGVGLLVLPEAGTNTQTTTQTLQISDTQVLGAKMVSEGHFQYLRTRLEQQPVSSAPSINVQGAFTGGGASGQTSSDNQDRYELQEIFTRQQGSHFLRFGARYRLLRDANLSTANYNGAFTFPSLTAYQITQQVLAASPAGTDPRTLDATIRATCVDTPSGQVCGGATQFNLTAGQASATVLTGDLSLFGEDEWKLGKSFTFDYGLRFETQSAIPDHFDPAPRVGFAWAVGQHEKKQPIVTLRGGGGIFYDRFDSVNILTAIRQQSGTLQPSFFVSNPNFYPQVPLPSALPGVLPSLYNISPQLRSEYGIVAGVAVERNLWNKGNITFNYLHSHDVHQWESVNINAPLPGTFVPADPAAGMPATGVYPRGTPQAVYQFQSGGVSTRDRFFTNINLHPTKTLNMFAFYVIRHQLTDATGATNFASNSYNIHADYGRSARPMQRLFVGSFWDLPFGFSVNAFLSATAGQPFNITTGTDLNGDTIYNDRPSFATDLTRPSVIKTRLGSFDTQPVAGQRIIPMNYGTGPAFADLDFGAGKRFKFGPKPPPAKAAEAPVGTPMLAGADEHADAPEARYSLGFSVDAENIFNHVNGGTPVGVLSSPFFGQSIALNSPFGFSNGPSAAANRVVSLHATFSF